MNTIAAILGILFAAADTPQSAAAVEVHYGRLQRQHTILVSNGPPFYSPGAMTIEAGETVHWRSGANAERHSVREAVHGTFSLEIAPGTDVSHQFKRAGEYSYRCRFHPWMSGKIIVEPKKLEVQWLTAPVDAGNVKSETIWRLSEDRGKILRSDGPGAVIEFTIPPTIANPIALAPLGNDLWILNGEGRIARMTDGEIEEYAADPSMRKVKKLVAGSRGELWLLDAQDRRIGIVVMEVRTLARLQ